MTDRAQELAEATRWARKAADLGKDDAVALSFAGLAFGYAAGDPATGLALIDKALLLNPNLAAAWTASGFLRAFRGDPDLAIEHSARAMRFSPLDPLMFFMHHSTALAQLLAGRHEEAWPAADMACRERPNYLSALRVAAASHALSGHPHEAQSYISRALELDPELRISNLTDQLARFGPLIWPSISMRCERRDCRNRSRRSSRAGGLSRYPALRLASPARSRARSRVLRSTPQR